MDDGPEHTDPPDDIDWTPTSVGDPGERATRAGALAAAFAFIDTMGWMLVDSDELLHEIGKRWPLELTAGDLEQCRKRFDASRSDGGRT